VAVVLEPQISSQKNKRGRYRHRPTNRVLSAHQAAVAGLSSTFYRITSTASRRACGPHHFFLPLPAFTRPVCVHALLARVSALLVFLLQLRRRLASLSSQSSELTLPSIKTTPSVIRGPKAQFRGFPPPALLTPQDIPLAMDRVSSPESNSFARTTPPLLDPGSVILKMRSLHFQWTCFWGAVPNYPGTRKVKDFARLF